MPWYDDETEENDDEKEFESKPQDRLVTESFIVGFQERTNRMVEDSIHKFQRQLDDIEKRPPAPCEHGEQMERMILTSTGEKDACAKLSKEVEDLAAHIHNYSAIVRLLKEEMREIKDSVNEMRTLWNQKEELLNAFGKPEFRMLPVSPQVNFTPENDADISDEDLAKAIGQTPPKEKAAANDDLDAIFASDDEIPF